jgi:hypothetical protein
MNLFKTLALTAMLALVASPVLAHDSGEEIVTIFAYENITLTTTDNCLSNFDETDDACANRALNTRYVVRPFHVTNLKTSVDSAGNAASTCDMFMEINGATKGNEETAFSVVTVTTIFDEAQNLDVIKGDLFSINVTDDSGCYDTTSPVLTVWVEGYYLSAPQTLNSHTPTAR